MIHHFRLISTFDLDYLSEKIVISGMGQYLRTLKGLEEYRNDSNSKVVMPIKQFIDFAKICIAYESGDNEDINLDLYGIKFHTGLWGLRVFSYKNLAMPRGEIYFMYEVLIRSLCPDEFFITVLWENELCPLSCKKFLFMSKSGYAFICDSKMYDMVCFNMAKALQLTFTISGKPKAGEIGFDTVAELGKIQYIKMPYSGFFPQLSIHYRDMSIGLPYRDWERLKGLFNSYLLGIFDDY